MAGHPPWYALQQQSDADIEWQWTGYHHEMDRLFEGDRAMTAAATAIPTHDEILAATGLNGLEMKFRCRIFEHPPMTIALLTDLDDANPSPSITNSIEHAVGAVLRRWPEINSARLVVVEHYDDRPAHARVAEKFRRVLEIGRENSESFHLVTFDVELEALRDRSADLWRSPTEPHRKRTTKADVEHLISGRLP